MGAVSPRLDRAYKVVKVGTSLPIIITTTSSVTPRVLDDATRSGLTRARIVSQLVNQYAGDATEDVARRLAAQPDVVIVSYDEPIGLIGGPARGG